MRTIFKFITIIMLVTIFAFTACGGSSSNNSGVPGTYTVTFDSQGATIASDPASVTVTSPATTVGTLPAPPTKTNNNFEGWFTGVNGGGTAFTASTTVNADITVYANWTMLDYTSPNIGTLKHVPAGSFQRDFDAANVSIIATAFRMSEKEITRAQFVAVTGLADPSSALSSGTDDPVQQANWYHALVFCNMLSISEGLTPVYSIMVTGAANTDPADWIADNGGLVPTSIISNAVWDAAVANWNANGYRLPTEMEWEWAAMGATSGSTGYLKAFAGSTGSNAIGDYAVFGYYGVETGRTITERSDPAGSKLANELGLYDMSGNVREWCWDWYGVYPAGAISSDTEAGRGAAPNTVRVVRGGSWTDPAAKCTVADRPWCAPSILQEDGGFRVVRK